MKDKATVVVEVHDGSVEVVYIAPGVRILIMDYDTDDGKPWIFEVRGDEQGRVPISEVN